jgi:hypothetical protein
MTMDVRPVRKYKEQAAKVNWRVIHAPFQNFLRKTKKKR